MKISDPFEGRDPYAETTPGNGKQDTPLDQLQVVLQSIEAWMLNFEEGWTEKETMLARCKIHFDHLEHLMPYLKKGSW